MKRIKSLTIQGFRGFNKLYELMEFNDNINLIYGPNSYGKTSISEALEWLLYGITSKLEAATNNKTEYHGSYRNIHFPENEVPFVEAVFVLDDDSEVVYRGELQENDSIQRFLNGKKVENWPWAVDAINDPKPFIVQHALKNLLMATPSDRYQGFTKLIGEEELGSLQDHFISLSTKYDPPREIKDFRTSFSELEKKFLELPKLEKISKLYNKNDFEKLYDVILAECQSRTHITSNTFSEILPEIKRVRGEAVNKLFDKQLTISGYSEKEEYQNIEDNNYLINAITDSFSKEYLSLIEIATIQNIMDRAQFLNYGYGLLSVQDKTGECPFCGHPLSEDQKNHIKHECEKINENAASSKAFQSRQEAIKSQIKTLKQRIDDSYSRHISISKSLLLLNNQEAFQQMESIYGLDSQVHYTATTNALVEIQAQKDSLDTSFSNISSCVNSVDQSIIKSEESVELLSQLANALIEYVKNSDAYKVTIEKHLGNISEAGKVLATKLDVQAGTQELSILIELIERRDNIIKRMKIENILSSVKELQKQVKEYASDKLEDTVRIDLSKSVRSWYDRIKTDGDPDVHFDGFDLPKNKSGVAKGRQISVNAKSYNKALPSAISSLSESKLNALGLSISIANNVKGNSTFGFLLIDDPVQSMDAGHSAQIIDIVRSLVEDDGKQIILLSHNSQWLKEVRKSCRSMNGRFYEIVSYTINGPNIRRCMWAGIDERFMEVKAWLAKPGLSSLEKQRVAEEFRFLYNELATDLYKAKTGNCEYPDGLNMATFRKLLIESDVSLVDVDKAYAAYNSVSEAHHQTSYNEPLEKLKDYLKIAERLNKYLQEARATRKVSEKGSKKKE